MDQVTKPASEVKIGDKFRVAGWKCVVQSIQYFGYDHLRFNFGIGPEGGIAQSGEIIMGNDHSFTVEEDPENEEHGPCSVVLSAFTYSPQLCGEKATVLVPRDDGVKYFVCDRHLGIWMRMT